MKIITNIFGRIWAFWGLISFIITFLIFFLPSMLSYAFKDEKKGQEYFIFISKIWMNIWLFLVGCSVKVTGKENFKKGITYIVVFNHNAFLDIPLSSPYVPGANKTIAKASFTKVPIFGLFYARGSVLVDRNDDKSRTKSYDAMKKTLAKGMHMCIYPEGTRNRTNYPLKTFYDGAFKLATDTKKDIIPCVILGTKKAMPISKKFFLLPISLRMHFMPAQYSSHIDAKQLKENTFEMMKAYYVQNV